MTGGPFRLLCALVAAMIGVAGCASAPPERFYRLSAVPAALPQEAATPGPTGLVIAIGPVGLPEVVDRPQIVTGTGVRVRLSETHRWAEPLRPAIGRVVAAHLSAALAAPQVLAHPQAPVAEPGYRVTLQVQRFDAELGGEVNDDVLWTVRRVGDGQLRSGRSVLRVPVSGADHDAVVAAHGLALQGVARDVAQAVRELMRP